MNPRARSGWLLAVVLGLCALAPACGSDDEKTPQEKYWAQYGELYCSRAAPCCEAAGQQNDLAACRRLVGAFGFVFSGGHFDKAAGDQCLVELAAWTCDQKEPAVCDTVFSGSTPPGGACDTSASCARPVSGDVTCHYDGSSGPTGTGTCKVIPTPAEGQPCGSDSSTSTELYRCDDAPDFYCDSSTSKCKLRAALGASCTIGSCVAGSTCVSDGSGGSTCTSLTPLGGDCSTIDCVDDAFCDSSNKCVPTKPAGEPCVSFGECQGFCDSTTHTCEGSSVSVSCVTSD